MNSIIIVDEKRMIIDPVKCTDVQNIFEFRLEGNTQAMPADCLNSNKLVDICTYNEP